MKIGGFIRQAHHDIRLVVENLGIAAQAADSSTDDKNFILEHTAILSSVEERFRIYREARKAARHKPET